MASEKFIPQAAAVPYRRVANSNVEVLLIRRKDRRDWGIPKGLVDPGCTEREAAEIEAHEEAGLEGELLSEPLGEFTYEKYRGLCRVRVFAMRVTAVHDDYDEKGYRIREWFDIASAVERVERKAVKDLIQELAKRLKQPLK